TYKVQIRNHKNFGFKLIWESPETSNTSFPYFGPPLGFGVYHVVVLALDGTNQTMSNEVPLEVRPSVGPPKPAPPAVTPGMVTPSMPFFITWARVNNPGVWTTYKVQVRQHKNFGFGLVWESASTANTGVAYTGPSLALGVYHVVVLAMDGTYETMSDPSQLEVRSSVGPPKPTNVAVTPNSVLPGQTFFVTWPRVTNPGVWTTYKVQIRNHFNFGFGLIWESAPTADVAIGYTGRLEPGQYHIVVVAMDGTYQVSSDIVPLTVRTPDPVVFPVTQPDVEPGERFACVRLPTGEGVRSYVASRFAWRGCDQTGQFAYDIWFTVSQVSRTRMFLHSITILPQRNDIRLLTLDVMSGGTDNFMDDNFLWPDVVELGKPRQVTFNRWFNLRGYLELKTGYIGEDMADSCAYRGLIDFGAVGDPGICP
ncbi:MAG TPA: hypothetical protein VK524_18465, partial [Polyangiaceae bacterium]|nr:hypothetical protein [Polyangiaceae bacterium]